MPPPIHTAENQQQPADGVAIKVDGDDHTAPLLEPKLGPDGDKEEDEDRKAAPFDEEEWDAFWIGTNWLMYARLLVQFSGDEAAGDGLVCCGVLLTAIFVGCHWAGGTWRRRFLSFSRPQLFITLAVCLCMLPRSAGPSSSV
ncbi:uncharacterized protein LOC112270171 [Brachypodium distachyon]|uniref:Uncharacterized protein n=1 Tax=Brachypodium distachyon TaxID=15368 RepID=A0A2K2DM25_BRADI|nr:uncharacterized protein LOC112270171 [Brachypodium distachyon]PNT75335.1 hypothetical protein BRADI_1g30355v3 [Brachypodium distachyon]|eukprot:XP_024313757.1 uncharacterized protein LOC112270171 [Brachypodium distachyon]